MVGLRSLSISLAAALASAALGCSSSPSTSSTPPTFTEVYATVLGPSCSSHHAAGQLDSFLDLSSQSAAYNSLVGVKADGPSCGTSGDVRVVAGSASTSLLYLKVSEATPPCGAQMPLDATPLSASDQAMIQDWINAGAQND